MTAELNTQRLRIENYLIGLGWDGSFYQIKRNAQTNKAEGIDTDIQQPTRPQSVQCRETGSRFAQSKNYGRSLIQKREAWTFELRLAFQVEVTAELFEKSLIEPTPHLTPKDNLRPALIRLIGTEATHPPEQDASSGSTFIFHFEVEDGRA